MNLARIITSRRRNLVRQYRILREMIWFKKQAKIICYFLRWKRKLKRIPSLFLKGNIANLTSFLAQVIVNLMILQSFAKLCKVIIMSVWKYL